jgi:hypothetical protein
MAKQTGPSRSAKIKLHRRPKDPQGQLREAARTTTKQFPKPPDLRPPWGSSHSSDNTTSGQQRSQTTGTDSAGKDIIFFAHTHGVDFMIDHQLGYKASLWLHGEGQSAFVEFWENVPTERVRINPSGGAVLCVPWKDFENLMSLVRSARGVHVCVLHDASGNIALTYLRGEVW